MEHEVINFAKFYGIFQTFYKIYMKPVTVLIMTC